MKCKVIEIGNWNMDVTATVVIAHGLTLDNIRSVHVLIRHDSANLTRPLCYPEDLNTTSGHWELNATNIVVARFPGGYFDSVGYDNNLFDRGTITIWHD